MNKKGLTLVEIMIVMATVGLVVALVVPAFVKIREHARRKALINNPVLYNAEALEKYSVEKLFEINGYDVYTFSYGAEIRIVTVPSTNSLLDLERK